MKKPTSVYIDTNLVLAMNAQGIEISPWINRAMALYLGVPEDPNDHLIKKKTDVVISTLLLSYESEIKKRVQEFTKDSEIQDKIKQQELDLIQFGEYLKKTTAYPVFKVCLANRDFDDDTLEIVTSEVNKMNGRRYEPMDLWNRAVNWYRKYGQVTG